MLFWLYGVFFLWSISDFVLLNRLTMRAREYQKNAYLQKQFSNILWCCESRCWMCMCERANAFDVLDGNNPNNKKKMKRRWNNHCNDTKYGDQVNLIIHDDATYIYSILLVIFCCCRCVFCLYFFPFSRFYFVRDKWLRQCGSMINQMIRTYVRFCKTLHKCFVVFILWSCT